MNDTIIVIGRQFGCGGREIGRRIAEAFGLPYYDKTLLSEAAAEVGIDPALLVNADERRPSFIRNFLGLHTGSADAPGEPGGMSEESLYKVQSDVIRRIARKGSCVIVGRTADHVLRHHPGLISMFIQAPIETRIDTIMKRGDAPTREKARDLAQKIDRKRESYYKYYTARPWGTAGNYHLCFDASKFDTDSVIAFLRHIIKD